MMKMTRDVLETQAAEFFGGDLAAMPLDRLQALLTVSQHATDLLLNEIEQRGELTFLDGMPLIPYMSDHSVETIVTREAR